MSTRYHCAATHTEQDVDCCLRAGHAGDHIGYEHVKTTWPQGMRRMGKRMTKAIAKKPKHVATRKQTASAPAMPRLRRAPPNGTPYPIEGCAVVDCTNEGALLWPEGSLYTEVKLDVPLCQDHADAAAAIAPPYQDPINIADLLAAESDGTPDDPDTEVTPEPEASAHFDDCSALEGGACDCRSPVDPEHEEGCAVEIGRECDCPATPRAPIPAYPDGRAPPPPPKRKRKPRGRAAEPDVPEPEIAEVPPLSDDMQRYAHEAGASPIIESQMSELYTAAERAKAAFSAVQALVIQSQADVDFAQQALRITLDEHARIDAQEKSATRPMTQALKEVRAWFKPAKSWLEACEKELRHKIEEANARFTSVRAEAAQIAEEAYQAGEYAVTREALVVASEAQLNLEKGAYFVGQWHYEIYDPSMLPRSFLQPNLKAIRTSVQALKGATRIPGVRVWQEEKLRVVHS